MQNKSETRKRYFISFETLCKREIKRFMRMGVQTLIAPFISNILFLGIFAGFFTGQTDGIKGIRYIFYITPGLVFSAVVMSAFQNPVFSIVTMKYQDTIRDFNLYPLKPYARMSAFIVAGSMRGFVIGVMTYLAAGIFSGYTIRFAAGFWTMIVLVSIIFSTAGYLAGTYVRSFEKSNFIVSMILTPLVYFGGVFFDTNKLPPLLRLINSFNPLSALIDFTRYSYSGIGKLPEAYSVILTVFLVILLFAASYRATVKGIGVKII
jgi:ABC-2 type transport system permease protein